MSTMLTAFVLLVAGTASTALGVVLHQQLRLSRGLPARSLWGFGFHPSGQRSNGGRHRAHGHVKPMQNWDADTGPIPLAEVAMKARRLRWTR